MMKKKSILVLIFFSLSFLACNFLNDKNAISEKQKNISDSLRIDSTAKAIKIKIVNALIEAQVTNDSLDSNNEE
jgi:hypothetical protein